MWMKEIMQSNSCTLHLLATLKAVISGFQRGGGGGNALCGKYSNNYYVKGLQQDYSIYL